MKDPFILGSEYQQWKKSRKDKNRKIILLALVVAAVAITYAVGK